MVSLQIDNPLARAVEGDGWIEAEAEIEGHRVEEEALTIDSLAPKTAQVVAAVAVIPNDKVVFAIEGDMRPRQTLPARQGLQRPEAADRADERIAANVGTPHLLRQIERRAPAVAPYKKERIAVRRPAEGRGVRR